ncbi:arginase [Helicobacter cappadocius]|uniref:Arginase n=1 Tax=Helicobacter cappadocius TaxID=3063998 RepID=A0AA90PW89_9HELI|nr:MULTISPECIES: arginase [unclassified Helicobacter]MDO7253528.1 arginase [Helicobacter sp. faydin-H75]MDP2539455.1 arginase [Helicobacter sp. faydin-H76]
MSLQIVGIYSDIAASKRGAAKGVDVLMGLLQKSYSAMVEKEIKIINNRNPKAEKASYAKNIQEIYDFFKDDLIPKMKNVFQEKSFPLIFSGDHSSALGTIQALKSSYPQKSIAIVWIDAHSDIHTPYDSSSGNIHGMPLGGVVNVAKSGENILDKNIENQWEKLCTLGGDGEIKPQNIVYIGTRSMEKSERDIIKKFNIPLYQVSQIRKDTVGSIDKIISYLDFVDMVYLSVDIDVLDGKIFTSTGVRENNGLYPDELDKCIKLIIEGLNQKLVAVEFTEFNPTLEDSNHNRDNEVLLNIITNTIDSLKKLFP